jgi:hypothetical protein
MKRWLPVLLIALAASAPVFASQERILASIARINVTEEQQPKFTKILNAHYNTMKMMVQREMGSTTSDDLPKDIDRRSKSINEATAKKMSSVLRPDQMDELRYLLNLIADDYKAQNGISD